MMPAAYAQDAVLKLIGRTGHGPSLAVGVAGETAVVGDGGHLLTIDLANPQAPAVLGGVMLPGVVRDVVATEGYAFVANGQHGLRVVDVTDPSAPVEVAHFLPEGFVRARAVALDGTDLYVDFGSPGIYLLDVTDPAGPVLLGSHPAISGGEIMALAA